MAEQEVIKHTKKVYKIWNSKEHSFWHKTKEFCIEIAIIVFAVSLSIWLHGISEHRHDQKDVKEFLLGLHDDLKKDITEMENNIKSYQVQKEAFRYIRSFKKGELANRDSVMKHFDGLVNTTVLIPNDGRYEGFKSSGKIENIENGVIKSNILDLYQQNIPSLLSVTNNYVNSKKEIFNNFFRKNIKRETDSTTNFLQLLNHDEIYYVSDFFMYTEEIIGEYESCIEKMKTIISELEKEYNLK